ncbi:MAG: AAA family ATPase [Kiritimatiellae bacterium]|nr:AAA family ATPase [Kiritimatiellia bacterium]
MADKIDWNEKMLCVKGPKGTGKTTLLLQHVKETFGASSSKAVYFALDHIWFSNHDPIDAIEYFYSHGYTHLFIDEVHHYRDWSRLMKTAADFYPGLHIVYSGSSILKLSAAQADLSRRQLVYCLKGLSFREFLAYEGVARFETVALEDLLANHRRIAADICKEVKVLPLFSRYLKEGYYPFYKESSGHFAEKLVEVVNSVLNVDLPAVEGVTPPTVLKARRLLMVLAKSCPQQPNMSALYRELETERNMGVRLLEALERAELFAGVDQGPGKLKHLSRPEKIYLGDTNLMNALVAAPDAGALRETFFANQLRAAGHDLKTPAKGDFVVDSRQIFEIGGAGKGFGQIKDVADSYVVNDGVELGIGNKIPLWLFGFLY